MSMNFFKVIFSVLGLPQSRKILGADFSNGKPNRIKSCSVTDNVSWTNYTSSKCSWLIFCWHEGNTSSLFVSHGVNGEHGPQIVDEVSNTGQHGTGNQIFTDAQFSGSTLLWHSVIGFWRGFWFLHNNEKVQNNSKLKSEEKIFFHYFFEKF